MTLVWSAGAGRTSPGKCFRLYTQEAFLELKVGADGTEGESAKRAGNSTKTYGDPDSYSRCPLA